MDRRLYKQPFRKDTHPHWICPTCGKGVLKIKKDAFFFTETYSSKKDHGHEDWDEEWIQYVYSCVLECSNNLCKDVVLSTGKGSVHCDIELDDEGNPQPEWCDYFQPKFFHPHLELFSIPESVPTDVVEEINQSFELFFCSPSSAANHIRIALENLLTHMKVNRIESIKKGKRRFLSLHSRIALLPAKYENLKDSFRAIKWLGNEGSHSASITLDDVMDAYEIMEEALRELFERKREHIKKLVKKINKKKGSISHGVRPMNMQ